MPSTILTPALRTAVAAAAGLFLVGCVQPVTSSSLGSLRTVDFSVELERRPNGIVDARVEGSAGAAPVIFDSGERLCLDGLAFPPQSSLLGGSVFLARITADQAVVELRLVSPRYGEDSMQIPMPIVQLEGVHMDGLTIECRYLPNGDGTIQTTASVTQTRGDAAVCSRRRVVEDTGLVSIDLRTSTSTGGAAAVFGPGEATLTVRRQRRFYRDLPTLGSGMAISAASTASVDLQLPEMPGWPPANAKSSKPEEGSP